MVFVSLLCLDGPAVCLNLPHDLAITHATSVPVFVEERFYASYTRPSLLVCVGVADG
jgi:hypothetical protein